MYTQINLHFTGHGYTCRITSNYSISEGAKFSWGHAPRPPNWHFASITHVDRSSSWCWTNHRLFPMGLSGRPFNVHTIQKQLW